MPTPERIEAINALLADNLWRWGAPVGEILGVLEEVMADVNDAHSKARERQLAFAPLFPIGAVVLFVGIDGVERHAQITRMWDHNVANLAVLKDGSNDPRYNTPQPWVWETSIPYAEDGSPRSWRWYK